MLGLELIHVNKINPSVVKIFLGTDISEIL